MHPARIDSEHDVKIKRLAGKLDRVLVDAPCSGLGTLRRNPDLKWRQTPVSVAELAAKQASILRAAAGLVKPGGRLVYATCSLLDAENDGVVDGFLAEHPEFAPVSAQDVLSGQGIAVEEPARACAWRRTGTARTVSLPRSWSVDEREKNLRPLLNASLGRPQFRRVLLAARARWRRFSAIASWWLAYRLRRNRHAHVLNGHNALLAFGAGSIKRIAFPLIALILAGVLRRVLEHLGVGHLALLSVASLLLASWVLVRIFVYVLRGVFPHGSFLRNFERFAAFVIWGGMIIEMTGLSDERHRRARTGLVQRRPAGASICGRCCTAR